MLVCFLCRKGAVVRALRTGASRGVRYTMGRARTGIVYQVTVWQRYEQLGEHVSILDFLVEMLNVNL